VLPPASPLNDYFMPSSSVSRPWWRSPGPLLALLLHVAVFAGLFQLRFADGAWRKMDRSLPPHPTTAQWFRVIVAEHGYGGLVTWFFDTHTEIRLYRRFAEVALRGVDPERPADAPGQGRLALYRDVPMEYQPGALLAFVPPALFARNLHDYETTFTLWCGVLYLAALLLGLRVLGRDEPIAPRGAARGLWWSLAFLLCFGGVAAARFDHAVPLACLAAAWAFQRAERTGSLAWFAAAGALVAGGVMIKIVPGMLLGAMFGWLVVFPATKRWRPMLPVVAGFGIALALLHAAFVAHWGDGYLASYTYHVKRGLQLESTFAGVIMAGHGFGGPLGIAYVSKAYDLETPFTGVLVSLSPALFLALAGVLAVRVAAARRLAGGPRRDFALVLLTIALLLAFMLTNKVFSPQYLLWLGPLFAVALAAERALWAPAVALLLAAGITQAIFPHFYDQLRLMQPWTVLLLNLRNLILVVLLGWLLWRLPRLLVAPPRS
jgi:hypothetical protein